MPPILEQEVFLGFTVLQILVLLGVLLAISAVFGRIKAKKQSVGHDLRTNIRCFGCGWEGKVSKHTLRCPRCGNTGLTPDKM